MDPFINPDYYFSGVKISELAIKNEKTVIEIKKLIYEARRILRIILSEFAEKRWGIQIKGHCRICIHPRRAEIENILRSKKRKQMMHVACAEKGFIVKIYPENIKGQFAIFVIKK